MKRLRSIEINLMNVAADFLSDGSPVHWRHSGGLSEWMC